MQHVSVIGLPGRTWRVSGPRGRALLVRRSIRGLYGVRYAHNSPHSSRAVCGSQQQVLTLCERFARRFC